MRNPGAHMAVSTDGSYVGSLSGGCIEKAVVTEALDGLKAGKSRIVRFGEGSPYLDIKLPCGGGLDVHFMPLFNDAVSALCAQSVNARKPFSISLPTGEGAAQFGENGSHSGVTRENRNIIVSHEPNPKILIIGHGAVTSSLARLSREMSFDLQILTSDELLKEELESASFDACFLKTPTETSAIQTDIWTAIIFLFHDHDWEGKLMAFALDQPHFYLGAMGGRTAHKNRKVTLKGLGVGANKIESIRAPIGLFHSSRDPDTLALSALAEITQAFHNRT